MITRKQNLTALLQGETPAWVPCAINFAQWYDHHRAQGTLPASLEQAPNYIGAMKRLGLDIFSRNLDGGYREEFDGVTPIETVEQQPEGPRHTTVLETPHGALARVFQDQSRLTTGYHVEDLIKDWERDRAAYFWLLEHSRTRWDSAAFAKTFAEVGDDGVVVVPIGRTPLKRVHQDFGLDHACLFLVDYPDDARQICDLVWAKLWPSLVELAADPRVQAACLMDNVDTPFYPPAICDRYWTPYVRQAAELLEAHGKRLLVHACGKLHQLRDTFRASRVHGLEGMAHEPIGDFPPRDAGSIRQGFIYNGGFTPQEQVIKSDDQARQFYRQFFAELDGYPQFIFAAACQTTPATSWDRLQLAVALCREHGGSPA